MNHSCRCSGTLQGSMGYPRTKSKYTPLLAGMRRTHKKHQGLRYSLTGRPWARSTYTNSTAADGTTLFWYDCWNWYCRICRNRENKPAHQHRERRAPTTEWVHLYHPHITSWVGSVSSSSSTLHRQNICKTSEDSNLLQSG